MIPSNLDDFKIQQTELHRRAASYRLARSLRRPSRWTDKVYTTIGQTLIMIGQQMLSRTQAAH